MGQALSSERTRGNKDRHKRFTLSVRNFFFCEGDQVGEQIAQRGCEISTHDGLQKLYGHNSGQLGEIRWSLEDSSKLSSSAVL